MKSTHPVLDSETVDEIFLSSLKLIKKSVPLSSLPSVKDTLSRRIEHTLLKIDASDTDVINMCHTAIKYNFRAVCCMPRDTSRCSSLLSQTDIMVVQVIDFPLGMGAPGQAAAWADAAVADGADEIDMLLDIRAVKAGDVATAANKIIEVTEACRNRPVKVILETGLLSPKEIISGCAAAYAAGAAFVKTSTGFGPRGASVDDVRLMRMAVKDRVLIKAAGGIKTPVFAKQLIDAGADVIGTSDGPGCL
jgi:deoxyribose-phosphate aldolase